MVIEQVGNIFRLPTSNYHYRYVHQLFLESTARQQENFYV